MKVRLLAISPIDGRYGNKTAELTNYFSEFALIKYRIFVEIEYFIALCNYLDDLSGFEKKNYSVLRDIHKNFNIEDASRIKEIENTTNHDVKAVEYFLKEKFDENNWSEFKEFIHFGLTSQDINNTALPLIIKDATFSIYMPQLYNVVNILKDLAQKWVKVPMLSRTHGQPASPTILGKEIMVFVERLEEQIKQLSQIPLKAKFGGATGNLNAHYVAYPKSDWMGFAETFIKNIGLERHKYTTQIQHYDDLGDVFDNMKRINTILLDLSRDFWTYISLDYFKQKIKAGEVGSSAMPHKVNPIDFENAEGNIGLANALFEHLSAKMPVSRLQRDLTDSTVSRSIGLPFGHTLIALKSLEKGLLKVNLNEDKLEEDLSQNWAVVAEAIQTILRSINYPNPYEALKELTRTGQKITQSTMLKFIDSLKVDDSIKIRMKKITPYNYTGKIRPFDFD
jgi:adenylosuccinate lyase